MPGRTVVRSLGESLRAEVLLVWDGTQLAAAKVPRPRDGYRKTDLAKLRHEAEIVRRLEHPVVPRCLDLVLEGARPHILFELAEGQLLRELVRRQRYIPLAQGLPLFRDLADAVAHIASRGIVHGDLTPENVIVGVTPHIIDFGRSREAQTAGERTRPLPARQYRAPEYCEPSPERGPIAAPADVFSLGALMYSALTGHRPFPAPPRAADGAKGPPPQLTHPPEPFRRPLPRDVRRLIRRMLATEQERRPTAAEVVTALDAAIEHDAVRDRRLARTGSLVARLTARRGW